MATARPEIKAALDRGRHARSLAFVRLFRRTRPDRSGAVKPKGMAAA